jgi:hypothetical protein
MPEFVIVKLLPDNDDRQVFVDDDPNGRTNQTITVDRGHHKFQLGGEQNYSPPSQSLNIEDTVSPFSKEITFEKNEE